MPTDTLAGWVAAVAVTLLGALLRLWDLARPHAMVFDETYYVKDALSLWRFGYERETVPGADAKLLAGNPHIFTPTAEFVAHPPVGKYVIGLGEWLVGASPVGWRLPGAVCGILLVLATARIARRLTRSTLVGAVAGLLVAVDGMAIALSRTALLDGPLALFVLLSFGALLLDRDRTRALLAGWLATPGAASARFGPSLGLRPWRWVAGLLLGLACGTKWSGVWFLAAFGVLTLLWDAAARRAAGITAPRRGALLRDAPLAFVALVGTAAATYAAAWSRWLLTFHQQVRGQDWSLEYRGWSWLPAPVRGLLGNHAQMLYFNTHLQTPHAYAAKPIGWLLQLRPTAFWSDSVRHGVDGCTASTCTREVIALGTPLLWWAADLALVYLVWRWAAGRDWRAGAVLCGVAAAWLPWVVLYSTRTVFGFYMIVAVPFLAMALAMALAALVGGVAASAERRMWGATASGVVLLLAVANSWWIYPLVTGAPLSYQTWLHRLVFRGWI